MMRPDFSEVESATAILIAAQDGDWGPIQHQGLLHDRASYRYYWELLARAQRHRHDSCPSAAQQRFFA
jgi:citrate lyase subunit beta/citryl-CoA lyase